MIDDDDGAYEPYPYDGGFCPKCKGTGRDSFSDGLIDCEHCQGEGYEWWE